MMDVQEARKRFFEDLPRATIEQTFGPNPCRRTKFRNIDTGEVAAVQCDSPRCDDCGPRKAAALWQGITEELGGQVTLIGVNDDDDHNYRRHRNRLRKKGGKIVSVHLGANKRAILTDIHDDQGVRVQTASLKKRVVEAYKQGAARLRKSWDLFSVALSPKRVSRKSATSWRFGEFTRGFWVDAATPEQLHERIVAAQEERLDAWKLRNLRLRSRPSIQLA